MSFEDDLTEFEYDMEPQTAFVLKVFRDGMEHLESERNLYEQSAAEVSDFLYDQDEKTKGLMVIDLLTLVGYLESVILELQTKEMT